ncbi:aflatoxin regulatory protein-domain-containing protein [Usnea florida]
MTARRPADLVNARLRDSCQACAVSKVKCLKEKPACSRCARRGVKCEYFVMRRPGRRREGSRPSNDDSDRDGRNRNTGSSGSLTNMDLSPPSPRLGSRSGIECPTSDLFSNLWTPLDSNLFSALEGEADMFNNLLDSPIDGFELEPKDSSNHDPDAFSETFSFDHSSTSKSSISSSNTQSLLNGNMSASGPPVSASCCLIQALNLMRKLSSTKPTVCILIDDQNDVAIMPKVGTDAVLSVQTVVAENQQTLEIVSNMLQCSCVEDGYLLTILSMVVLKALERYAAAARKQSEIAGEKDCKPSANTFTQEETRQISSVGDQKVGRLEAQLILGELHCVQRLVKQLAPKLKARGVGAGGKEGGDMERDISRGDSHVPSLSEGGMTKGPFSVTIFDQIDADLRKALSALSSEIIRMLRKI